MNRKDHQKIGKLLDEWVKEHGEVSELFPDSHMVATNRRTGEKYVTKDHHILIQKLLIKKLSIHVKLITSILKILKKDKE